MNADEKSNTLSLIMRQVDDHYDAELRKMALQRRMIKTKINGMDLERQLRAMTIMERRATEPRATEPVITSINDITLPALPNENSSNDNQFDASRFQSWSPFIANDQIKSSPPPIPPIQSIPPPPIQEPISLPKQEIEQDSNDRSRRVKRRNARKEKQKLKEKEKREKAEAKKKARTKAKARKKARTKGLSMDQVYQIQKEIKSGKELYSHCPICGLKNLKSTIIDHVLVHTSEQPFQCDHCYTRFKRKKSVKYHIDKGDCVYFRVNKKNKKKRTRR